MVCLYTLSLSLTGMLFSCKKEENTAIYDDMMDLQIIKVNKLDRGRQILCGITYMGFLDVSAVKNSPANAGDAGDTGLIPGLRRSPGVRNGNSSSILAWKIPWTENPMVGYSL